MAVSDYAIPWAPPDLTAGIQLLLSARKQKKDSARADRNEEVNRLNADINLRRVNDTIAREHAEFDVARRNDERLRRQEQAAALEHVDQLARTKPGVARGYGSAYGIDLRERPQAAPPPAQQTNPLLAAVSPPPAEPPPEMMPMASDPDAVDAVSGGGLDEGPPPNIDPSRMVTIDEPFTIDADVPKAPPMAAAPPMAPPQAAPVAPTNRLFQAVMAGQAYDLDATQQPTGLGPKYDALYNRFLMEPGGEKTAFAKVMAAWEREQGQEAQAQRTADTIASRETLARELRPDVATQEEWLNRRLSQSERNARIGAASRVAAAGTEKPSAADSSEARAQTAFNADFKDFRDRTATAQKEVAATRQISEIRKLAASENPVDQALAVEQIGKIAHGGNTVTKATQDLIYHHMGGAFERGEAALRQFTDHGTMAPQQLKMLRDTARELAHHHDENKKTIQQGFEIQFGPRSAYGSEYMQPYARQHLNALYSQMGVEPTSDAAPQTEQSIRLGRRRGESTGASGMKKPAPGIPAGSQQLPGKVGPNGRPVWRSADGKLHEQDS